MLYFVNKNDEIVTELDFPMVFKNRELVFGPLFLKPFIKKLPISHALNDKIFLNYPHDFQAGDLLVYGNEVIEVLTVEHRYLNVRRAVNGFFENIPESAELKEYSTIKIPPLLIKATAIDELEDTILQYMFFKPAAGQWVPAKTGLILTENDNQLFVKFHINSEIEEDKYFIQLTVSSVTSNPFTPLYDSGFLYNSGVIYDQSKPLIIGEFLAFHPVLVSVTVCSEFLNNFFEVEEWL